MTLVLWILGVWLVLCALFAWAAARWFRYLRDG